MRDLMEIVGIFEGLGLLDHMDGPPPNPEACKTCKWHPSNIKLREEEKGQHCYMFNKLPETLCMQHAQIK